MKRLKDFAEAIFSEYNSEGSRTATNIEEVESGSNYIIYEYDYTSLNGQTKRLRKEFLVDDEDRLIHKGPVPVGE